MSSPPNIPDSSVPGLLARSQPPEAWIYDRDPANGIARATFNGEVYALTISSPAAGVSAFNGRTGSVTLNLADVEAAGGAPLASPAFTGNPTVPTQASGTSNNDAASTAFVMQAVQQGAGVVTFNGRSGAVQLTLGDVTSVGGAPLASPALSGAPTAPTAVVSDNSSLLATTAYVNNWGAQNTVLSFNGRRGAVTLTLADVESVGGAPIASPSFTGTPVVPTAAPGTSSGQAASCAFVENAITAGVSGVASFNGRTGAVTLTTADVTTAGGAPSLSPVLTGTPTGPTAVAGTNTGQLATCAFVETAIGSIAPIVNSFNGRNGTVTLTLGDVTGVGGAPIASPSFTGTPTVPTAAPGTNTTEAASCAFVEAAIASVAGVSSFNTRQGAVTLALTDITGAGGAPIAAPALTGAATLNGSAIATAASVAAGYLPLAGGTLTGALNGTTINGNGGTIAGTTFSTAGDNIAGTLTTGGAIAVNGTGLTTIAGSVQISGSGGLSVPNGPAGIHGNVTVSAGNVVTHSAGVGAAFCTVNDGAGVACGFYQGAGPQYVIAQMDGGGNPSVNWMVFNASGMSPAGGNDTGQVGWPGNAFFSMASYSFANQSDERLKQDIEPASDMLGVVNAVAVRNFRWRGRDEAPLHIGWLAQDVQAATPGLATVIEGDDEAKTLALNSMEMTAILWKAVQEVAKVVERLDRSIAEVTAEVERLKEGQGHERHSQRTRHH